MQRLTLTRFDPEPPDDPQRWQVGYDAVLEDGREVHSVTTVYRSQTPNGERAEVLAIADAAILPGLILQDREIPPGLPVAQEAPAAAPDVPAPPPGPKPARSHTHGSEQ